MEGQFEFIGSTIRKTDPPVRVVGGGNPFKAVWSQRGALDFEGGFRGFMAGFDAKVCAGARFALRRVEGHQLERMAKIEQDGMISGAIVEYEPSERSEQLIVLIPHRTLRAVLDDGDRSIKAATALQLNTPEMENRTYRLDPFDYRVLETALEAELALALERHGIRLPG